MKRVVFSLAFVIGFIIVNAQVPQGFNYQAVARDVSEMPITDPIDVRIAILSDDVPETVIWEELHTGVDPDLHGLFSIVVGQGTWLYGPANISLIDWTVTPLYIRTQIYYSGEWKNMGSAQLWSVPYAMVADSLGGPLNKLRVQAAAGSTLDEALFEVKNKTGQTIFAVYNEGVRIYVDDGTKGAKGGFSVGGFGTEKGISQPLLVVNTDSIRAYVYDDPLSKTPKGGFSVGGYDAAKGVTNEYLLVSPDSVRIYIDKAPSTKAPKGGFSVGGFDQAKGPDEEYLRVTRDSTRVYVNDNPVKSVKGGFAIGGFTTGKSSVTNFTSLTPDNYFIGHKSGSRNTSGLYNSFLGYEAGLSNTAGSSNALFGFQSGYMNSSGLGNLFLGYQSGYHNTEGNYNSFMGYKAGYSNTSGDLNSFFGSFAGVNNTDGTYNTFSGFEAGYSNINGQLNSFFGSESGYSNISGIKNTFIGPGSGFNNISGSYNIFIGHRAGVSNNSDYNIYIGDQCGYKSTSGSMNIFIGYNSGFNNNASNNIFMGAKAGYNNSDGEGNIFLGLESGYTNTGGYNNVFVGNGTGYNSSGYNNLFLGNGSGYNITSGHGNIFIGNGAGGFETESNKLYITNQSTATPLIYGDFSSPYLVINGNHNYEKTFFVTGPAGGTTEWAVVSDAIFKENIKTISDPIDKVSKLRGVNFNFIDDQRFEKGTKIGFIAQEVLHVLPEIVTESKDGYTIEYAPVTALLVEAVKVQQKEIESQKQVNQLLKSQLQTLEEEVEQIKALLETKGGK